MSPIISFWGISLLGMMSALVYAGHHDVVDDEIWAHVFKVLSDTEHGKKVIVGYPEPAHLVDAYTKVDSYHHEPFAYRDAHHHHHQPHHHHHAPAPVYHHGHHGAYHLHAHPLPLHHAPPPHHHHHQVYEPPHHHHHQHAPAGAEPVFRVPFAIPPLRDAYGLPHLHSPRHHKK